MTFLSKIINKIKMQFSLQVFVVGAILSITFFLLLVDSFKTYRTDILILVNPKFEIAIKQQEQLISNIIEFPQTLSFYDRMLKDNSNVRDVTANLSPDQRKAKWNQMLTVSRASLDASVFKISITTSRENDSQQLAEKTTRTLFNTISFYYDIKNDVDLRVIDGPISKSQVPGFYWFLILSIISGFAFAILLNFIFFSDKKNLVSDDDLPKSNSFFDLKKTTAISAEQELELFNNLYQNEQLDEPFVFEQNIENNQLSQKDATLISANNKNLQEIKKITKDLEPSKYPNFPEMPIGHKNVSNAPDNLPIADDNSYFEQYLIPEELTAEPQVEQIIQQDLIIKEIKEPTPEELKKRLNQLLRGEL